MSEEAVQQQTEEEKVEQLPDIMKKIPDAPTQDQIEKWKAEYGEVYVSGFSETELFVWHPIARPAYVQIQELVQNPEHQMTQFKFEELVCDSCVLWKSVKVSWEKGKAGTPQSLFEQIMNQSNFLTPAASSMLVAKL